MNKPSLNASDPLSEENADALTALFEQEARNHKSISRISGVLDRLSDELTADASYEDRKRIIELLHSIQAQQAALADIQRYSNTLLSRILLHVMWITLAAIVIAVKLLWF